MQCTQERAEALVTGIEGKVFLYNLLSMKLIDERNVELAVRFSDFVYG